MAGPPETQHEYRGEVYDLAHHISVALEGLSESILRLQENCPGRAVDTDVDLELAELYTRVQLARNQVFRLMRRTEF